jgi:hypothetical protein
MSITNKPTYWEPLVYRPSLPEGWFVEEQFGDSKAERTTFVKYGKVHHNAEPTKIYVVFIEFNEKHRNSPEYGFTVRGGRNAKPDEDLYYFKDLKSAGEYLRYVCETTDKWLEDVNSPATIAAYEKKIANLIRTAEMPR